MLKIAITPEISDPRNEIGEIRAILDGGWDRVHLRHPSATRDELLGIIEALPSDLHGRIVLHSHFDLTDVFTLGGLHLNHRCPSAPDSYSGPLSRSCHSIAEIKSDQTYAYVTLSPIFDSISKRGYSSAFTGDDLAGLSDIDMPVIALGGVTPERIGELKRYNFSGFAMLGALPWSAGASEMSRFVKQLKNL